MRSIKLSFYKTLILIIVSSVMLVIGVKATLFYKDTEVRIVADLKAESAISLLALQKNLSHFMSSYAVNEYEKLIVSAMEERHFIGILVEDFNMGNLLNKTAYQTGSLRNSEWQVVSVDENPALAKTIFSQCFYKDQTEIYSDKGAQLGVISICSTDKFIKKELEALVVKSFWEAAWLSLLLIGLLIFTIRLFLLKPISDLLIRIDDSGEDGLPVHKLPLQGAKEVISVSSSINNMVETIRVSKEALKAEKERFELAIKGSQDGLWDWDVPSGRLYHSVRFETMLGYSGHELPETIEAWSGLLHPDDVSRAMENVQDYFDAQGHLSYQSTFRMKTKNGGWCWVSGRGLATFDKAGKPVRFVGFNTDITTQMEHQQALDYTAKHDALTGLPNRFLFNELIEKSMAYAQRNNNFLALLFIDLDGFKEVNDHFGHDIGDCLLKEIAQRINKVIRAEDITARLGGDEFVLALTGFDNKEGVGIFINRFLTDLAAEVNCLDKNITGLVVSASVGVSFYPQEKNIGSEVLLRQADHAMYQAKSAGKNRYHIYNVEEDNALKIHLANMENFKEALSLNQFVLHYQPRVNLKTGEVLGVEALLRWQHPEEGLIYPDSFLPKMNQEASIMLDLSRWVIEKAIEQLSNWIEEGLDFVMSINISAHDLANPDFERYLNNVIARYPNVLPNHIELEVLESTALEDTSDVRDLILETQASGINIALDDFGTGYSSLSYLKDLPVNTIKIDKSFVMDMTNNNASLSIIEASLGLASAFHCDVVAEGVETIEHGKRLIQLGCIKAQGYVIAKPMPASAIPDWVDGYSGFDEWKSVS